MKITKGAVIREPGSSVKNKTGNWRTFKPVVNKEKCTGCGQCWAYCPDSAINIINKKSVIDYDFCKGCGICANNCPFKGIYMIKEEK